MNRFDGKVVLVTGAGRGIGLATAEQFASEGATVVATDYDEAALESARQHLSAAGLDVDLRAHDVSDARAWKTIVADMLEQYGTLDVIVNNAGTGVFADIESTTLEELRTTFATNVEGVFHGTQLGIEAMRESGGAIVNVASIAANIAEPMLPAYAASKGAVRQLTKSAAVDCARKGYDIRINSIHPGYTETKLVTDALESLGDAAGQFTEDLMKVVPMGRIAAAIEIARPILFLASDDASFMTGSELIVDGGYTAA